MGGVVGAAAPRGMNDRVTVSTVSDDRTVYGAKRFLQGVVAGVLPHRIGGVHGTVSTFLNGNRRGFEG